MRDEIDINVDENLPTKSSVADGGIIPAQSSADNALDIIGRMVASGVQKETIDQMVSLIEWDDARKARMAFNTAFSLAKGKFKQAKKTGLNAHLGSRYSLLEDYDDASREALAQHGLSWRHVPSILDGDILSIRCILAHQSGHSEECELRAPAHSMTNNAVNKLQSLGIVRAYLQRMTMASMLGLVSDTDMDNDGEGGDQSEAQPSTQSTYRPTKIVIPVEVENEVHDKTLLYLEARDAEKMRGLWGQYDADHQVALWKMFNSAQRSAIKTLINGDKK